MNTDIWPVILFYGNVIIVVIVFLILIDKSRLSELLPIGFFIAVENYTFEMLGLHFGYWSYPLDNPGYPEIIIISSLFYFPLIAMLFYQYLSKSIVKNILLIAGFVAYNMIIEIVTVTTTNIFLYKRNINLFMVLLIYISIYIIIIGFGYLYKKLITIGDRRM